MRRAKTSMMKATIDETGPRRDVGKVGHPQGVRMRRFELPIDAIERTRGGRIADCGADPFAPHHALQAHRAHQARYGAASDRGPFPQKLSPDLPDAINAEILLVYPPDFGPQGDIAPGPYRQFARIGTPDGVGVIRRRGDRQNAADRLDPVDGAVLVDEGDHGLNRRSSFARGKKTEALRRACPGEGRGSRLLAAVPGSPARAPSTGPAPRSSCRPEAPLRVRADAATSAGFPRCSRSWPRSSRSPSTAKRARPGARAPFARLAPSPQPSSSSLSSWFPWLHPLRSGSLRETRGGSEPITGSVRPTGIGVHPCAGGGASSP